MRLVRNSIGKYLYKSSIQSSHRLVRSYIWKDLYKSPSFFPFSHVEHGKEREFDLSKERLPPQRLGDKEK